MKKLILFLAFLTQTALVFATDHQTTGRQTENRRTVTTRYENTKMHRQPGTSTQILRSLHSNDEIQYVRQYNQSWSIVLVDGQVGYVLTSELGITKNKPNVTIAKK
ncbi:SH3 domain-containing protein [Adhaeribacter rhizoryzae]|uniref:SH3 domain-containing protein n=1 Tax=Adhaeribacter rhizoryzae TaxID=2607907 RepID=A0A5M6DIU0_9BACT|nr:SH3 domain-containing protein [Adhaeribacter rhizoryzae]KAA5547497.1 SH3 domain-containing protein [Adhaeribacter rhizoryzae]